MLRITSNCELASRRSCTRPALAGPAIGGPCPSRRSRAPQLHGASSSEAASTAGGTVTAEPTVSVKFVQPDAEAVTLTCLSGEQLRAVMLDEKVDLYTTWGKIWSCGGGGQCGTCIVQVDEGAELLSERTAAEERKLKGKPANWRLACQTIVGDGSNAGSVCITTKPQQAK